MATKFQIKRTSISGRTPNTADPANSSFIAAGELAVNLIDEKVFSSNGSVSFEVGANLTSVAVANLVTVGNSTIKTTINSTSIAVTKIFANGVTGSAGQVLSANSTGGIYWETSAGGAGTLTVTSDTFNGNNSNTIFTLSTSSTTDRSFVYLNGVQQAPTTDYTISGTTLTFVVAPPSDNVIEVRSFDIPSIADITVTTDTFTANGTQTNFTLSTPDSSVTNSLVFLNGVTQVPTTDYTLSSTTLTFLSAPANNTAVQAISFTSAGVKSAAFTGNGSNTQFTLPVISTTLKTIVAINGVTQTPVTDYSVSGTTLIFAVAPVNNDNILVRVLPSKVDSAGGNTQIQYNKSGSLGGSAGFTFNDTTNNVTIGNTLIVPNFILNASNPPANSTATGNTGTFAWDSSFLYVAVGTNDWKKVAITTDGSGGGTVAGSNTEIQFNDIGSFGANNKFTFHKTTTTLGIGSNVTVNTSTIFIGNSTVNTTITAGNVHLQGTQLTVGNVVITGDQVTIGNSTVNSVITTTGLTAAGNATFSGHLMPSANVTYDLGNSDMRWRDLWLAGTTINLGGATLKTDSESGAVAIIPKPTAVNPNPRGIVFSPRGGVTSVDTTGGTLASNAVQIATESNTADPVPIDIKTSPPANGQMLVWSADSNTFISHSTVTSLTVTGNTNVVANGTTGLNIYRDAVLGGQNITIRENAEGHLVYFNSTASNPKSVTYEVNASGNTTPDVTHNFTVEGAVRLKANSTVVRANTSFQAGNTTITGFANVSTTLQVGTNTATIGTALYVVANGNVGINTSNPVEGVGGTNGFSFIITGAGGGSVLQFNGENGRIRPVSGGSRLEIDGGNLFLNQNYNTNIIMVGGGGNVGIANTTPSVRLQIGNLSSVSTATPEILSLGGTFSSTAGSNIKIRVYDDGSAIAGMGVSSGQAEVVTWSTGRLAFMRSTTKMAEFDTSNNLVPGANGSYNLGSSTSRWGTVFTSDLDLSNGIGDWTIVEGEDDLFIYNNKRGKVYKFKLEEVDPSVATPKKENL